MVVDIVVGAAPVVVVLVAFNMPATDIEWGAMAAT